MKPPAHSFDDPDRQIQLEEQLEPFVQASMEAARQSGFKPIEIERAIANLALNWVRMIKENARTDAAISMARRRRAH